MSQNFESGYHILAYGSNINLYVQISISTRKVRNLGLPERVLHSYTKVCVLILAFQSFQTVCGMALQPL
jgi:hypothetical protein